MKKLKSDLYPLSVLALLLLFSIMYWTDLISGYTALKWAFICFSIIYVANLVINAPIMEDDSDIDTWREQNRKLKELQNKSKHQSK